MIVDTNVLSEFRKGANANQGVLAFWKSLDPESEYITVQVIGEIRAGVDRIALRGDKKQALSLEKWLEKVTHDYSQRVLCFDSEAGLLWGRLMARSNQNPIDKQIAAIALMHGMPIATRNVKHFLDTGVKIINPFQ